MKQFAFLALGLLAAAPTFAQKHALEQAPQLPTSARVKAPMPTHAVVDIDHRPCLLYTSDAATTPYV